MESTVTSFKPRQPRTLSQGFANKAFGIPSNRLGGYEAPTPVHPQSIAWL